MCTLFCLVDKPYVSRKKKINTVRAVETAAVSPAGLFCFVQVSVGESILPVQYSTYQLSPVGVKRISPVHKFMLVFHISEVKMWGLPAGS